MASFLKVTFFIFFIAVLATNSLALEATRVITNSEKWEDVYSTLLYAGLRDLEGDFLTSAAHGPLLLNSISLSNEVGVVTSRASPFVFDYPSIIESRGYRGVDELKVSDANLELIEDLEEIENFVVVGNSYGFSAMAVTPYARQSNSWVFLADRTNIAEIESIISQRGPGDVLIYGYVDREVNDALEQFDPEIINTGDRFEDNIQIVEKYLKSSDTKQILLSNGEFIERELMRGVHPVLFTGRENVPDKIAEYLQGSSIEVGVLVGNELINAATNIRRDAGISVMVKFAQGARAQTSGVSAVEGLDLFYLPSPILNLEVYSVKYNAASSQIELTYHSTSNVPLYLKGSLIIDSEEGRQAIGDAEPIFIAPDDYKTIIYTKNSADEEIRVSGDASAEITTLFGEVSTSLDRQLTGNFDIGLIDIIDNCEIDIDYVKYVKQNNGFFVKVENLEDSDCYVDIELEDIIINNVEQTIGTEGSEFIKAGKKKRIKIDQRMDDTDLEENGFVNLVAYYGEREESLVKVFRGKYELDIDLLSRTTVAIIVVLLLMLILLFILWRMKKRDEW